MVLQLAAACSRGQALPGMEPSAPINILYQTAEDGLGDTIEKQAERALMSPSNYIRAAAMHSRLKVILDGKAVARELNAIGRNLNQLTVLANMGKIDAVYLDKLHKDLCRLYQGFIELASQEVR